MINRHPATKSKTKPGIRTRSVALFGRAELVKVAGSQYELRGASEDEATAAKEWVSLFSHNVCLAISMQTATTDGRG
jgi:hypothetical protein